MYYSWNYKVPLYGPLNEQEALLSRRAQRVHLVYRGVLSHIYWERICLWLINHFLVMAAPKATELGGSTGDQDRVSVGSVAVRIGLGLGL